jgi:predicted regulator of Ras-like GTPase activity (Roadblock/LC7/MglB family)
MNIIEPGLAAAARTAVDDLMHDVKGVNAVVISSEDGFEIAARVQNTAQIARLSAMASSLAALGVLAGEESQLGACENITISAQNGNLIMLQARHPQMSLILSIVTDRQAIIGQILYSGKRVVKMLEDA